MPDVLFARPSSIVFPPGSETTGAQLFRRIAGLLLVRGIVLMLLAALTIRWPELALVGAMTAAGAFAALTGVYELAAAAVSHERASTKYFVIAHGAASVGFGAVVLGIAIAPPRFAFTVTILWLLAYGTYTALLGARAWWYRDARAILLVWTASSVAVALVLTFMAAVTATSLLYALALYTALWGVAQLAASRWIQRWLQRWDH